MNLLRGLLCLALGLLVYVCAPADATLRAGLCLFTLIGSLWMTQALPLPATALLVPLLATLGGLMTTRDALASFAHPIIFLFLGGFALATALQNQGLDRALATAVLRLAGGKHLPAILLLFAMTAFMSMWISNTATVAIMLPLAFGLLVQTPTQTEKASPEQIFVLLGLAYSASIGGIGTLVGSPPNAIAAAQANISFAAWLKFGIPMVLLLLPLMVVILYLLLRPRLDAQIETPDEPFEWTRARVITVVIFLLTGAGWIGGAPLAAALGIKGDIDSVVALAAIALLTITGAAKWHEIERNTQWGVLLLFGGGLALSQVMDVSGASRFLADQLVTALKGASLLVLFLGVIAFVVFLTELISNTACAALLIPIFLGVGNSLGVSPLLFTSAIAIAASCAFMLPVATPPNAMVYATGMVPQASMMKAGLVLNLVCIGVIAVVSMGLA